MLVVVASHSVSLLAFAAIGASKIVSIMILVMMLLGGRRLILAGVSPRPPTCGRVIKLLLDLIIFIMRPL